MSNREPQVWDVWESRDSSLLYIIVTERYMIYDIPVCAVDVVWDKCYIVSIEFLWNDYVYKGKLAPRYKRLFGIYYIKDNSNDQ